MPPSTAPARSLTALVSLAIVSAGVVASCSGGQSAQEALDELRISDEPKMVVATAVERLDPTMVLGPDLVTDYLQVKFALRGYSWADAACAVERTRAVVTGEVLDSLSVARLDDLAYDHPGLETETRTCASAESLARLDLPDDVTTTTQEGQPRARAATDIDGAVVARMSRGFYERTAEDLGLTTAERDCMFEAVFGGRSDAEMVGLLTGAIPTSIEATADDVAACLDGDRFDEVTPVAAKELLARKDAVAEEHDRVQEILDASVNSTVPATTVPATTVPPATAPATTLPAG